MISIFLSYCEKAHDNKEFSRENSKPCPLIPNHNLLNQTLQNENVKKCLYTNSYTQKQDQRIQYL